MSTNPRLTFIAATHAAILAAAIPASAETIKLRFGDNADQFARDGECDDPRFFGRGMGSSLNDERIGHDAADCQHHFEMGTVKLWIESVARSRTNCSKINFGDNASDYARDGVCDDMRFKGAGMADIALPEDIGHDAADCRAACTSGSVYIRNY